MSNRRRASVEREPRDGPLARQLHELEVRRRALPAAELPVMAPRRVREAGPPHAPSATRQDGRRRMD